MSEPKDEEVLELPAALPRGAGGAGERRRAADPRGRSASGETAISLASAMGASRALRALSVSG